MTRREGALAGARRTALACLLAAAAAAAAAVAGAAAAETGGAATTAAQTGAAETGAAATGDAQTGAEAATGAAAASSAVPAEVMAEGEALYLRNCRFCHGTRGTAGKPLKENEALEDGAYVAGVILWGPGYMAAFEDHLSDEEIALIATYIRNSWGNDYGPVAAEEVTSLR